MKRLGHWIAHQFGLNKGMPEAFWKDGKLMMGFLCFGCGKITGIHEIKVKS